MTTAHNTLGTLEHLSPDALQLEDNVRGDLALDKAFLANVKENGVVVPLTAVRLPDGTVHVRTGQRRTVAARQAGLATVPVYVRDLDGDNESAARVIEQIVENDHRTQLTDTDRVFGIQQLFDDGLTATQIGKKLTVPAKTVKAARAAATSQVAIDALTDRQISLDEAAVIAEFDGDENAVERLLRHAGTERFAHVAAEIRASQAEAEELARVEQQWLDKGYTVLDGQPASFDPECVPLDQLLRADGADAQESDVTDPAHWAVLLDESAVFTDRETKEPVDERLIDWSTESNPDEEAEEGLRHFNSVVETSEWAPLYFCVDFASAGLVPSERFVRYAGVHRFTNADELAQRYDINTASSTTGETYQQPNITESDPDAVSRERKKVLALNRLGEAAQTVRRDFVTKLLSRKTPPKGAAIFVAKALAGDAYLLTLNHADELAAQLLLSVDTYQGRQEIRNYIDGLTPAAGDGRAAVVTLGLVLGALEANTPKDAWRSTSTWSRRTGSGDYLRFLVDNGYTLAPVEEVVTGTKSSDTVYDEYLAEK